jgi:MFS family permease
LGWVVAIFELGCMFGAFLIGRYADKYGRKRAMLWNAFLLVISSVGIPLSANATILTVWRFIQGFSVGAASVLSPMYILSGRHRPIEIVRRISAVGHADQIQPDQ